MDEEDIYGDDIYAVATFDRTNATTGTNSTLQGLPPINSNSAVEIAALEKKLAERDARVSELEAQLRAALKNVDAWRNAFQDASSGGLDARAVVDPAMAASELKRLRSSAEKHPTEDVSTIRQREAALQMQLAERNLENIELRRQVHTARQAADPAIAQVRQLLLDPAVEREFGRMRTELEGKAKEVKGLQEELQAVQFSQESKAGRMLMAKCRALQDENEEMGRELAEGKVHSLERQVAISKAYVEDMRARYLELEDHAHSLDAESEDLHQQVFILKRQLREAEVRSVSTSRERPLRPMQSGGGPKFNGPGGFGGMGHSLPGPPGGGPSPHRHGHGGGSMGRFPESPMQSPDSERKRPGNMDRFGGMKRMR